MSPLLRIESQTVEIRTGRGVIRAVDDLSFVLDQGQTLGIVGESGSGKTVLCRSILRLLPGYARVDDSSRVVFQGQDLNALKESELRRLRGARLAIVFQDPMTSLNPVLSIGRQVSEGLRVHRGLSRRSAWRRAVELLDEVGIAQPVMRAKQYPHQLSGGMRQRVAIAIALSCEPQLLIADEPTTSLDVTVQADILDLLQRVQRERGMALILVSHDLAIVAGRTDRVAVMYAGRIVEEAATTDLFVRPMMPYSAALVGAVPRVDTSGRQGFRGIDGNAPDLYDPPAGCAFGPRCSYRQEKCRRARPALDRLSERRVACWFPLDRLVPAT